MIKLFGKKKKPEQMEMDIPDLIVAQSVLIVNSDEVYHAGDIVEVTLRDGTVHTGRIEDIVLTGMYMNSRPYISLDESSEFNKNVVCIYVEEISHIRLAEEES